MKNFVFITLFSFCLLSFQVASAAEVLLMEVLQLSSGAIGGKQKSSINIYFANGTTERIDLPEAAEFKGATSENLKIVVEQLNRFYKLGYELEESHEGFVLANGVANRLTTYILVKG